MAGTLLQTLKAVVNMTGAATSHRFYWAYDYQVKVFDEDRSLQ
jgi:hypothetical protein